MSTSRLRLIALPVLAASALATAGCGGSADESAADKFARTAESQLKTQKPVSTQAQKAPTATKIQPTAGERDLSKKPKIPKSTGPAPKQLKVEDLVVGSGPAAKNGDKVSVQYVGVLYDNNKQFDASWDRGKRPLDVTLGAGQVIAGWDEGLVGLRKGGRRLLIIPPDLGYGPAGQGPIAPNETLVFVVDRVD